MQNPPHRNLIGQTLAPVFLLAVGVIVLSLVAVFTLPAVSEAQVSITISAQEMFDTNVFLEDGNRRPSFVIVDDQFEKDFDDGKVNTILSDELDGKENSDFITNLSISLAGSSPYLTEYMDNKAQFGVGFILFSEFTEQNRLTLDGVLETSAADTWLPRPWYASLTNALQSSTSDNVSTAEGTASRSTETYTLTGRLGIANLEVLRNVTWGLGYTGTYHVFLGELRFDDEAPGETEEEGSDFHSHSIGSSFTYQATSSLSFALSGDIGVQYFTNVETTDIDRETRDEDDLDRTNYNTRLTMIYTPDRHFSARAFVGSATSEYMETPQPAEVTVIDEDGQTRNIIVTRDDTETSLVFGGELGYNFAPGTSVLAGVDQNVGTDIDGDRITTRSIYSNGAFALTDRLSLSLSARFLEFSSNDDLDESTERVELSSSFSLLVTQQASLVLGYNYVDQNADDPFADGALRTRANEYQAHRVYLGFNVGFLGLPG